MEKVTLRQSTFPVHGWIGLGLIAVFWTLNWSLQGIRTHWGFFPMWLGYCLAMDALVFLRRGTSLLTRDWRKYIGLFLISAPVWWFFEGINERLGNWHYLAADEFSPLAYTIWASISFTTVIPAVFGTAEFISSFEFMRKVGKGPVIRPTPLVTRLFFAAGIIMFALMWLMPNLFFPFAWLSLYFILEPVNIWSGNRSLGDYTARGDWRPVLSLWLGVLITAFFWEMWNYFSYPKWIYQIPWADWLHIFEMPILGYGGYLPFALELYAVYHFVMGLFGQPKTDYVQIDPERNAP